MGTPRADIRVLRRLMPSENGITVLDADTQETSYGTLIVEGLPLIFDTHRKGRWFVSSIEILTETLRPIRIGRGPVARFGRVAASHGILSTPYSGCFFKGNLHVYAFDGLVRGLDLSSLGRSVAESETTLDSRVRTLWPRIPAAVRRAQRDLLEGRRKARYSADIDVLRRRRRAARTT